MAGRSLDTLSREPAKVLRTTYSIQPETIAYQLNNDTSLIPDDFMRLQNYKDVTHEYWQTSNVETRLFKPKTVIPKAVYISVWNFSRWRPVWFAKVKSMGTATFTNMCKGVVYLPMYYYRQKMIPAGWPVINAYNYTKVLQPDTLNKRIIHIYEAPQYLAFRSGKRYRLYYWKNQWEYLGERTPGTKSTELTYENVPSNALLLLLPEYTRGKERPFIITSNGERQWF